MAAITQNLSTSTTVMYTDRRDFYIKPNVVREQYPLVTPFLTFVSNFNQITGLKDPQFKMFQHKNPWVRQYLYVTTGVTCTTLNTHYSITLDASKSLGVPSTLGESIVGFKCNVHNVDANDQPTGAALGTVIITKSNTSPDYFVKATSSGLVIPSDSALEIIGTEFGEGSSAPASDSDDLKVVWNQCGIQRTSFQLTKVLMRASLRGESNEYNRMKILKSQTHQVQKERNLMFSASQIGTNLTGADSFGDGGLTDEDGNAMRPTYGAFQAILDYGVTDTSDVDQNIFDVTEASYTYSDYVDDTEKSFRYVSDGVQPLFVGQKFNSYWSKLAGPGGGGISGKSKWQVQLSGTKTGRLGFNYKELETPNGIYQLVVTPSLTNSPYNKYGFAPGKDDIFHAIYEKPMYAQNIVRDNNPLYQKNEYVSQEGIGLTNLPVHKMFRLV